MPPSIFRALGEITFACLALDGDACGWGVLPEESGVDIVPQNEARVELVQLPLNAALLRNAAQATRGRQTSDTDLVKDEAQAWRQMNLWCQNLMDGLFCAAAVTRSVLNGRSSGLAVRVKGGAKLVFFPPPHLSTMPVAGLQHGMRRRRQQPCTSANIISQ